jgi:NAD(P)-dependent dehydrogenase (short-subunit alcohol dehydrogenase family)
MSISISLEGKVALVTGAAGEKGIGRSIALTFAEAGADVAICDEVVDTYDRNLAAVADEISNVGVRSLAIKADVASKADVDSMVSRVEAELGPVDILVNNAAILGPGSTDPFACTEEEWDRVMAVDLKGHYLCSMAVGTGMIERKTGNIIHIDSIEANMQLNGAARPYAVAKAAVQQLTRMSARQLAPHNIRVNSICTGAVETDMGFHNMWYAGNKEKPAQLDNPDRKLFGPGIAQYIPLGRPGEPTEIANTALFLASDLSSYITGTIVIADGGWTC